MHVPEKDRAFKNHPQYGSDESFGNNGAFLIHKSDGWDLLVLASDGAEWDKAFPGIRPKWEHVSVSAKKDNRIRTPTWDEMCRIKDIFWDEEDIVIQFHPRASEYINQHPHTLHLWRPIDIEFPTPPKGAVGYV